MNRSLPCLLKSPSWRKRRPQKAINTDNITIDPTDDIFHPRVRQIISTDPKVLHYIDPSKTKQLEQQHLQQVQTNEQFMKQFDQRKWLTKKGKKYLIDFDNSQRREMKQYFNSLDRKGCGSIGIDQLEELLLSVGLSENREEIKALIDSVDQDKSGKIQFGQFLSMIQNDQGQNQEIVSFFKTVIGGKLKPNPKKTPTIRNYNTRLPQKPPKTGISDILTRHPYPKGLSFQMVVSHIRRKHMMTALNIGRKDMGESSYDANVERIAKGQRVMQALQKMYERKLVMQIKESKRSSNLSKTEGTQVKRGLSQGQAWVDGRQTN